MFSLFNDFFFLKSSEESFMEQKFYILIYQIKFYIIVINLSFMRKVFMPSLKCFAWT